MSIDFQTHCHVKNFDLQRILKQFRLLLSQSYSIWLLIIISLLVSRFFPISTVESSKSLTLVLLVLKDWFQLRSIQSSVWFVSLYSLNSSREYRRAWSHKRLQRSVQREQRINLSGTYCHKTGTRPPSFTTPWEPTIYALPHVQYSISFLIRCFETQVFYFLVFQKLSKMLIDNCTSGSAPFVVLLEIHNNLPPG